MKLKVSSDLFLVRMCACLSGGGLRQEIYLNSAVCFFFFAPSNSNLLKGSENSLHHWLKPPTSREDHENLMTVINYSRSFRPQIRQHHSP